MQEESDLGIIISSDLKPTHHCKLVCRGANTMLGNITSLQEAEEIILTHHNSMYKKLLKEVYRFYVFLVSKHVVGHNITRESC